jgi:hypothetical protein
MADHFGLWWSVMLSLWTTDLESWGGRDNVANDLAIIAKSRDFVKNYFCVYSIE